MRSALMAHRVRARRVSALWGLNRLASPSEIRQFRTMNHGKISRVLKVGFAAMAVTAGVIAVRGAERKGNDRGGSEAEDLRRYDRNANGKLDPDESAAMRADQAREKARTEPKEREKETEKDKEKAPKKG